jgi:hypothetical protein
MCFVQSSGNDPFIGYLVGYRLYILRGHLLYYPQKPILKNYFGKIKNGQLFLSISKKLSEKFKMKNTVFCLQSIMLRFSKIPEKHDSITFFIYLLGKGFRRILLSPIIEKGDGKKRKPPSEIFMRNL